MNVNRDYLSEALIQFDLIVANKDLSFAEAWSQLNIIFEEISDVFREDLKQILHAEFTSLLDLNEVRCAKR